jgi:predicted nucleic acid-binding protein
MPSVSTVFVDTNVLLYAQDPRDLRKRGLAERWLVWCWQARRARISTQVLNELYANLRRTAPTLSLDASRALVRRYRLWNPWLVDEVTVDIAWQIQDVHSLSYWDALMVAAARQQGCAFLLTEDLQHDQRIDGVHIVSPFLTGPDFVEQSVP